MAIRAIIGRNTPQWMLALATTHEGDVPLFLASSVFVKKPERIIA